MSHDEQNKEMQNVTPLQMRNELEQYFNHVLTHSPEAIRVMTMIAGHEEPDGNMHACTLIGGPPMLVAEALLSMIDELVRRDPSLGPFFLFNMLARAKMSGLANIELINLDQIKNDGTASAEEQVADLLNKISGNKPPSGSVH